MTEHLARGAAGRLGPRPRGLLVDVGFTLTTYDGTRIAALAEENGVHVLPEAVQRTEREIRAELAEHAWPQRPQSAAPVSGGTRFMLRVLELAGARGDDAVLVRAAEAIWTAHLQRNLWTRVLPGVPEALTRLRAAGIPMAIVSNSEGTVEALLEEAGLREPFAVVLDSWHVGFAKPDPRIFAVALEGLGVAARDAVMVGDSLPADVEGAIAAGARGALLDPFDLYPTATAPRFSSFADFAEAVLATS